MVHAKTDTFTFFFTNNIWFSLLCSPVIVYQVGRTCRFGRSLPCLCRTVLHTHTHSRTSTSLSGSKPIGPEMGVVVVLCCMLYVVVLPSFISTPSVRPDSFSERDTDSVVTGRKTEEDKQTKSNRKFKCQASECRPKWGGYFF